jgi:chemotaxis signal transduction protein
MRDNRSEQTFLVGYLGSRTVAIPALNVERVLRMAAITPLPDLAPGIAGVVNLHGEILPVVDPRPIFGLPTPLPHPDQHLVVLAARTHYMLWVDRIERVVTAAVEDIVGMDVPASQPHAPFLLRLKGEVIPALSPHALDPGSFMHQPADRLP